MTTLNAFIAGMSRDLLALYMAGVAAGAVVFRIRNAEGDIPEPAGEFWRHALRYTLGWPVTFVRYLLS